MRKHNGWTIALSSLLSLTVAYGQGLGAQQDPNNVGSAWYAALSGQQPGQGRQALVAQRGSAVDFGSLNAPNGDFIIAAPPGWGFKGDAYENPITIAAPGVGGPSLTIWAAIWVTGLAEQIMAPGALAGAQSSLNVCGPIAQVMSVHTTRWSPNQTLPLFAAYLRENGSPAQIVSQSPFGRDSADATMRFIEGNITFDAHLSLSMISVPSPSYSPIVQFAAMKCPGIRPAQTYESFAFLTSCAAPTGTLARWEHTCAAILASFYPRQNWLVAYARQFAQQMQVSAAQVNELVGALRRAGQKQLQNQLDYMENNWNTWRQRGAALGGDVLLKTHEGNEITRPGFYDTYCENSIGQVWGTNDPTLPPDCVYHLPSVGTR